jgi:hypothetical protein
MWKRAERILKHDELHNPNRGARPLGTGAIRRQVVKAFDKTTKANKGGKKGDQSAA